MTDRCGDTAVVVASVLAGVAAVLLVLEAGLALLARSWAGAGRSRKSVRHLCFWWYRALVVGSLGSLVVGFVLTRIDEYEAGEHTGWAAVASERQGAILIVSSVVILVLAGVILELLSALRRTRPD